MHDTTGTGMPGRAFSIVNTLFPDLIPIHSDLDVCGPGPDPVLLLLLQKVAECRRASNFGAKLFVTEETLQSEKTVASVAEIGKSYKLLLPLLGSLNSHWSASRHCLAASP